MPPTTSALAEINIEAMLNPAKVARGQQVELTITVTGAGGGIQAPKLPSLKGFESYSQGHSEELSYVNGQSSRRSIFTYVLVPQEEGTFVIDGIEVPIQGKTFKTGQLKLEVTPESNGPPRTSAGKPIARVVPPSSRALPPEYMASQEIFVRASTDREEAYVNQPIYLTYTLYTRTSATFKGFEDEPETTGFWVEDFPANPQVNREERVLGGYRYVIADVRQVALFPTEAGVKRFNPGSLKVDVEILHGPPSGPQFQNPFFRQRVYPGQFRTEIQPRILETEPVNFSIKPLPAEGKPADFGGAVGHFKIAASLDQKQVEEGHPFTLKVQVTGEGNLNTLQMPAAPKMADFKSYDSSSNLNLRKDRGVVEGEKTVDTVFVPRRAGAFQIPAIEFTYFDPMNEKYVTLKTQALPIQVTPAPAGEEEPEPDPAPAASSAGTVPTPRDPVPSKPNPALAGIEGIRFVKSDPDAVARLTAPSLPKRSFWLVQASALLTALIFLLLRLVFERLGVNWLGAKPRRFKGEAAKNFRRAKQAIKDGSEREFFESLSKGVYGYFADKLRVEIGGVGIARVEEALAGRVSDDEMKNIKALFDQLDYARFSTAKVSQGDMKKILGDAEAVVARVEKVKL